MLRIEALLSNSDTVDWSALRDLICRVFQIERDLDTVRRAWQGSDLCALAFDGIRLVGGGRAISDGVASSALYDVVVDPEYQGQGIGREIVGFLLARLPKRSVMLVSTKEAQSFYRKLGFRKLNSAYILMENFHHWEEDGYFDE